MRIEFSEKVLQNLFKTFLILENKDDIGEPLRNQILKETASYLNSALWTAEQISHFEQLFTNLSEPVEDGVSELQKTQIDFLYWYQVQNLFHAYFTFPLTHLNLNVVRALKQMIMQATNCEYFGLADVSHNFNRLQCLIQQIHRHFYQEKAPQKWLTLTCLIDLLDYLHMYTLDKKQALKLTPQSWIEQNMALKSTCEGVEQIMIKAIQSYKACLQIQLNLGATSNQKAVDKLRADFGIQEDLTPEFFEFVQCAFASTMNVTLYPISKKRVEFDSHLHPVEVFHQLIAIVKNESGIHSLNTLTSCIKVMWRIIQLDLYKDFGYDTMRDNPYFVEACKHYNFYVQFIQSLASAQIRPGEMEVETRSHLSSQKLLTYFLRFTDLFVRIRTRSMQTTLYPQLVEPLIQIIEVQPTNNLYNVNLGCQKLALKILKEITKSQTFDDSSQLQRLINRLKKELLILSEDLTGNPNKCRPNLQVDDTQRNTFSLRHRQEFISTNIRFLCYSIIRMDPNQINQNQNFIAHSRKIIESNLFEDSLKQLVFESNGCPHIDQQLVQKLLDPIYLHCVQLYTYVCNDLPQKINDFIDSGLLPTIVDSLSRRIPIQAEAFTIVIKFFKMLNLNTKSTLMLLHANCVERLFQLSLDHRAHKMIVMPQGGDRMFDMRNLVHTFANDKQAISDRIFDVCIQNLRACHQNAWDLTKDYTENEKLITEDMSEVQKSEIRDPYAKRQFNYEQCLEASAALLSYFCMDELEYMTDIEKHESCVIKTIRTSFTTKSVQELLYQILQTPIICSAADNFIFHFQESVTLIFMCQGFSFFSSYLKDLIKMIERAFTQLLETLGVDDLDQIGRMPVTLNFVDLSEPGATDAQIQIFKQIRPKDLVWVAIGKVHILLEMVIILDNLTRGHERLHFLPYFTEFIGQLVQNNHGFSSIFKLQSMLNRMYSQVFVDSTLNQKERSSRLIEQYRPQLENSFNWTNFKESEEPRNSLEDAKNLYYRFHLNTVASLEDKKATSVGGDAMFDFILPEEIGVINTLKCYKKLRLLLGQLRAFYNKGKCHIKDAQTADYLRYNELSAALVANEINKITMCVQDEPGFQQKEVLLVAMWFDRVIPDVTKLLCQKYRSVLSGVFLTELVKTHGLLDKVATILSWTVLQYEELDKLPGLKPLWTAHILQTILRNCIDLLVLLLQINYLHGSNFHNYLIPFKVDATKELTQEQANNLYPKLVRKLKGFMFSELFTPIMTHLFNRGQFLVFCDKYSETMSRNLAKLYLMLCSGGFREPFNLFSEQNINRQMNPQSNQMPLGLLPRALLGRQITREQLNPEQIQTLISMGFEEEQAVTALIQTQGDFEFALEALLAGQVRPVQQSVPEAAAAQPIEVEMVECAQVDEEEVDSVASTCALIKQTFIANLSHHFRSIQVSQKKSFVSKLFSFYKDSNKNPKIQSMIHHLFSDMIAVEVPDWLLVGFFINLIGYAREACFQDLDLAHILNLMVRNFGKQVGQVKDWTQKYFAPGVELTSEDEKFQESCNLNLYNIHMHMTLLYFLMTDLQCQQDAAAIKKLLDGEERSAYDIQESVSYEDVKKLREAEFLKSDTNEPLNLIKDETKAAEIVKGTFEALINLLKGFSNLQFEIASKQKQGVCFVLGHAIKLLKQISGLTVGEFDFRKSFLEKDGLKVLFDVKVIDSDWKSKRSHWDTDRVGDKELRDLLENVWNTPRDLQKWYETLIKRQMFFQFRANFKRSAEEAKSGRDLAEIICGQADQAAQPPTSPQFEPEQKNKTKQKTKYQGKQKLESKTRSKSEERREVESANISIPQQSKLKKVIKKYAEYNEQSFSDFVQYYNSQIFGHVIVNFGAFIAACAKVCVLKKVAVIAEGEEESKEQKFETKIMLKKQILKELLVDPNFNMGLATRPLVKPDFKADVTRYQQDVVCQLLEIFIQQTKGYKMEILKSLRDSQPPTSLISLQPEPMLAKESKLDRKIYYFDHVQILSILTSILVRNNSLVGVIFKHNDSKTIKFIFRNIYYLLAIQVSETRTVCLQDGKEDINHERLLAVVSFLTHLTLTNFGSSRFETAVKKEICAIFVSQLAKNLLFQPVSDTTWARSAALLMNYSPVWIIAKFLTMKQTEYDLSKDALSAINQKKTKFWRLQRSHLTKQLILQCNSMSDEPFALLDRIQNVCQNLQSNDLVLFTHIKANCLSSCISVITKIMRLFENSQTLGKILKEQGPLPADYNSSYDKTSSQDPLADDMEGEESEEDYSSGSESDGDDGDPSNGASDDGPSDMGDNAQMLDNDSWPEAEDSWDIEENDSVSSLEQDGFEMIQTNTVPSKGGRSPSNSQDSANEDPASDGSQENSESEDDDGMSYDQENQSMFSDEEEQQQENYYQEELSEHDEDSRSHDDEYSQTDEHRHEHEAQYILADRLPPSFGIPSGADNFERPADNFISLQDFFSFEDSNAALPGIRNQVQALHRHQHEEMNRMAQANGGIVNPISLLGQLENIRHLMTVSEPLGQFVEQVIKRRHEIQTFKKQMKETEGLFMLHMTILCQEMPSKPQLSQKSKDYIKINPDDFKDHMKIETKIASYQGQIATRNVLEIEGIDSLFLQSLSAQGLQNIADSQQIHNSIANSTGDNTVFGVLQDLVRFLQSQSPQRRQDILNQIQNNMNQYIPSEMFAEARALYTFNRDEFMRLINQGPRQPQSRAMAAEQLPQELRGRPRLISQDSIAVSMDLQGPTDTSHIIHPKPEEKEITIRGTRFVQNFFTTLQDLNEKYEKNPEVLTVETQCEAILNTALLPSETDTPRQMFGKIQNSVKTALTGFRLLSQELQLIQSVKILHRIPNLRTCLSLSILQMLNVEMAQFKQHRQNHNGSEVQPVYQSQMCTWSTEVSGHTEQMSMLNVLIFCLSTTAQMQQSMQEQHGSKPKNLLEVAVKVSKDPLVSKFAGFIGDIDQQKSVLESLLDNLIEFLEITEESPWLLSTFEGSLSEKNEFYERMIEQLSIILKPVLKELKGGQTKLVLPIQKICDLLISFKFKLTKKSLLLVRKILNDLCDASNQKVICDFMHDRLHMLLVQSIESLQTKATKLARTIDHISELLNIVNGINRLASENICDEELFLRVFGLANQIVAEEQDRAGRFEHQANVILMYKDEVKELMLLLFSLCEYNLKVIFANANTASTGVATNETASKPTTPENQIQTLTKEHLSIKSEPTTLEELLQKHLISLNQKDMHRFKTLLTFFIGNKKLINNFIKVNHQVINNELKKLAQMIPQILEFDTKRIIWKTELKKMHAKYKNERFDFQIRRESAFPDSFLQLNSISSKAWRGRFGIEFKGEDGIDEGGLTKEWFSLLSKEMLNEDMALFNKSQAGATYYPNPKSTVQPNYLDLFTFIGKVVGKALWDQHLLDCYFVKSFYKLILSISLTYHDLEDYDQELYKSLTWILENSEVENLCSSFVETIEYFGQQKEIELVEGGTNKVVNDENKWEYVTLVTNFRLYKAISTQVDAFLKGFYSVVPKDLLKMFDNRELELLISGLQNIDIDDLKENTIYMNYTANSKPVQYLWEVLQEFQNAERAEFIQFVTGSSKVPVEGFKGLRGLHGVAKFTIAKIPTSDQNRLPQSHTCMNQLDLPEYKDKETTKRMVMMAIKEGKLFGIL